MNPSPSSSDLGADEQAALWAARLDGSILSADQRIALEAWLSEQPGHRALLSYYCQFSADLEQQLPLIAGIKELSAEKPNPTMTAQPLPWLRRPLMAGVMLTAAAAVAVGFWLTQSASPSTNLATPVAQRQSLILADGSRIELNARTTLQATLGTHERHVRLADGEAFFTVHPDPDRPFIVETPAGSVRVTGTQFNVRTDSPAHLEVTVAEGSVQARPGTTPEQASRPTMLKSGHQLTATATATTVRLLSPDELRADLAWREGRAVFADVPLEKALGCFAHYHGRGISATSAAAGLHVGGRFSLDDLEGFLSSLEEVLPVQVNRQLNGNIQVDLRRTLASSPR